MHVEPEPAASSPIENEQVFQDEIERLENQVAEKDREMEEYKRQLAEKDAQIQSKSQAIAQTRTVYSVPTGATFKSQYDNGLRLYNSRRYSEAIAVFDQLLASRENNSLIDNCQYWKGECYYGMGNYEQAILEFQKVFQFPNSNKFDDAQLKLGLCYMQLNNREQARKEFDKRNRALTRPNTNASRRLIAAMRKVTISPLMRGPGINLPFAVVKRYRGTRYHCQW